MPWQGRDPGALANDVTIGRKGAGFCLNGATLDKQFQSLASHSEDVE